MAYFEIVDTITSPEAAIDAIIAKMSTVVGYSATKVSATTFVFEGPAKEGQRWAAKCVIGRSSSTRFYKMHCWAGEGLNGTSLINQSMQVAPEQSGNNNKYHHNLLLFNGYTRLQMGIGPESCIIRFSCAESAVAENSRWRNMWVFALGRSTPEYGNKVFPLVSTPQYREPSRSYFCNALGSHYDSNDSATNQNTVFLKHDGAGGKVWTGSNVLENGLFGNAPNTERRYEPIGKKLHFAKSLTTVFLPVYIRSADVLYGDMECFKVTFLKYLSHGSTITYNAQDWTLIACASRPVTDSDHIAIAYRE